MLAEVTCCWWKASIGCRGWMTRLGDPSKQQSITENYMMIDMMAAIARKDYQQRRLRQAQGIEKARASGVYKGRPVDAELRNRVRELLAAGLGIRAV
ncbi:putative resolvase, partial [Pseudomonas syringae pv. actinidiae ICMP 19070]